MMVLAGTVLVMRVLVGTVLVMMVLLGTALVIRVLVWRALVMRVLVGTVLVIKLNLPVLVGPHSSIQPFSHTLTFNFPGSLDHIRKQAFVSP